jgi:hypothetical protein
MSRLAVRTPPDERERPVAHVEKQRIDNQEHWREIENAGRMRHKGKRPQFAKAEAVI